MTTKKLHNFLFLAHVQSNERLLAITLKRDLNRMSQVYNFYADMYLEDIHTDICYNRLVYLGSTPRSPRK